MFCPCISVQAACTGARAVTGEGSQGQPHGTVPAFRAFLCPDRNAEPDIGRIGCGSSNSSCLQVKSVTMYFYLCPAPVFFDLRNFNGLSAARSGAVSGRNPVEPSAIPAAIRKSQNTQYDGGRGSLSDGRCGKGRSPARHSDAYFFGSTPNCFWKHLAK